MNKLTFTLLCTVVLSAAVMGQTFQGTIKRGTQAQSLFLVVKPSADLTDKPNNLQFTLAIPISVGARPTLSMLADRYSSYFSGVTIIQTAKHTADYVYLINYSPSTLQNKTYLANVEDTVAEVLFSGNIGDVSVIRLVQLPNGTATTGTDAEDGQYNFYTEFVNAPADKTNQTAMFYSYTGGTVENGSKGYEGYSSVETGAVGPVPIKWINFSIQKQNGTALLKWEVANQVNNDYYEIEAGKDLQTLSSIGRVSSSENKSVYSFTDVSLDKRQGKYAFYRIKQVDKDAKLTYSEIKKIPISGKEFAFDIVTNPLKGSELKISIQSTDNNRGSIRIFDLNGKQVYQTNITWMLGYSEQIVQLPALARGSYVANLLIGKEQYHAKFIK